MTSGSGVLQDQVPNLGWSKIRSPIWDDLRDEDRDDVPNPEEILKIIPESGVQFQENLGITLNIIITNP